MAHPSPIPCRCLLAEAGQAEMSRSIAELIELMPEEDRAAEPVRQKRLAVCVACRHLLSGTCALCGCYVEARAAVKTQRCPDAPDRWSAEETIDR